MVQKCTFRLQHPNNFVEQCKCHLDRLTLAAETQLVKARGVETEYLEQEFQFVLEHGLGELPDLPFKAHMRV